jgi:LPXTG-motif cell wall-anchored protein
MQHSSAGRWFAGFAVVGALVAASAAPALAQAPDARLGVYFPDVTVAAGHEGRIESPVMYGSEPLVLHDATIIYDLSGLAGVATLAEDGDIGRCTAPSPDRLVCTAPFEIGVDDWGLSGHFEVIVAPAAKAVNGASGVLKVSFEATGFEPVTHTAKVRVGEGVDLAGGPDVETAARPGGAFSAPLAVRNAGTTAAEGVTAVFHNDHALQVDKDKRYSNCTYEGTSLRTCRFDTTVEPGSTYRAALAYRLGRDTYAPGSQVGQLSWLTPAEFEDFTAYLDSRGISVGTPGTGGELSLKKVADAPRAARGVQADVDPTNNWSNLEVRVTGRNGADLVAVGDTVAGAAGDVVTATVGLRNDGPATLDFGRSGEPVTRIRITVPAGTTAVAVPEACAPMNGEDIDWDHAGKPGAGAYWCSSDWFVAAGETQTVEIGLRIDTVVPDAAGTVKINGPCSCPIFTDDLDPANDTAQLVVNPAGGAGGGGGLPVTGTVTASLVAAGVLLLAGGVAGFVIARRRRVRFVA